MTPPEAITAYAVVIYHPTSRDDDCRSAVFPGNDPAVLRSEAHAWATRELPADADYQIDVHPRDQASAPATDPPRLSDLSAAERRHPQFRRGYNLGYWHRAHEEKLSQVPEQKRRSTPIIPTTSPTSFGIDSGAVLEYLHPGVRVFRDLSAMTEQTITTQTPCCRRQITLPIPADDENTPAVCCRCGIAYDVELIQEEPDGYSDDEPPHVAIFTTRHLDVAIARHRTSPWEPKRSRSNRGAAGVNPRRDDHN